MMKGMLDSLSIEKQQTVVFLNFFRKARGEYKICGENFMFMTYKWFPAT